MMVKLKLIFRLCRHYLFLSLLCLLLPVTVSYAHDNDDGHDGDDHDAAKQLKEAGKIVSLEQLLADARTRHSGHILEIELQKRRGRYVYEIEMVDNTGNVHEFFYDAHDGTLLWEAEGETEENE